MIRNRIIRSLASVLLSTSLLCATPLAAQATTDSSCISGRARGAWDLPVRSQDGHVRGVLFDGAGNRLVLEARLLRSEDASAGPGGKLVGMLAPLTRTGVAARPIAEVHGTYTTDRRGQGRFEAAIVGLEARPGSRPALLGKLAGAFSDPMRDGRNPIGNFAGRWTLCR